MSRADRRAELFHKRAIPPKHALRLQARVTAIARQRYLAIPLKSGERTTVSSQGWIAFRTLCDGSEECSRSNWDLLAQTCNVTLLLSEQGIGEEYLSDLNLAIRVLLAVQGRAACSGLWRIDGDEREAIELALRVHDAQLDVASRNDILQACRTLRSRVQEGLVFRAAQI